MMLSTVLLFTSILSARSMEPPSKRQRTEVSPIDTLENTLRLMEDALKDAEAVAEKLGVSARKSVSKLISADTKIILQLVTHVALPAFKSTKWIEGAPTFLGGGKENRWKAIKGLILSGLDLAQQTAIKDTVNKTISALEAAGKQYDFMHFIDDNKDKIETLTDSFIDLAEDTEDSQRGATGKDVLTMLDQGVDVANDALSRKGMLEALLGGSEAVSDALMGTEKIITQLMTKDAQERTLKSRIIDALRAHPDTLDDLVWYERVLLDVEDQIKHASAKTSWKGFSVPNPILAKLYVERTLYTLHRDIAACGVAVAVLPVVLPSIAQETKKLVADELQKIYDAHAADLNAQERTLVQQIINAIRG